MLLFKRRLTRPSAVLMMDMMLFPIAVRFLVELAIFFAAGFSLMILFVISTISAMFFSIAVCFLVQWTVFFTTGLFLMIFMVIAAIASVITAMVTAMMCTVVGVCYYGWCTG